jgi:competence protein ComGC
MKPRKVNRHLFSDGSPFSRSSAAFTRWDLLAVVVVLALLACVAVPLVAIPKLHSQRAVCASNLRQIGRALQLWGNDHGDQTPWATEFSDGGMRNPPANSTLILIRNDAVVYYNWISNELVTPQLLVCPADSTRRAATDFSNLPGQGLNNAAFRDSALSYFIGLHGAFDFPQSALSGDRNLQMDSLQACSLGPTAVAAIFSRMSAVRWLDSPRIHGESGNLLLYDGRVEPVSNRGVNNYFSDLGDDIGSSHLIVPP